MPGPAAVNSLGRDLLYSMDPLAFAADCGMADLDPWQARFLTDGAEATGRRNVQILASRQVGKTESCILRSLHIAHTEPSETVLVISPRQQTSNEFIRRARSTYSKLPGAMKLLTDNTGSIEFENRSRIIGLPSSEDGVRGVPRVRCLLVDEAARVSDALYGSCRPMLAVHPRGELIALTSAGNAQGWFYSAWQDPGAAFEKIEVRATECPRLTPDFLESERKALGETMYRTEYMLEWLEPLESAFPSEVIDRAFGHKDVRPLWL